MRKSTQQIMWPGLAIVCLCVWWVDFNRPVAPEQVGQVGVDIFSDNHEVQPLKAYATSTGQPDSIWIRAENPTPGDILYVWDTGTGEGDLWGFNRKMELERLEGGSANVDTTTGALTAKFLEQHPESIDQAIWPYDQNRQPSPTQHPGVQTTITGDFKLSENYFRFTGVADDLAVDLAKLKHCQDPAHNALVDYYSRDWMITGTNFVDKPGSLEIKQ